jgi:hypothetical protein
MDGVVITKIRKKLEKILAQPRSSKIWTPLQVKIATNFDCFR